MNYEKLLGDSIKSVPGLGQYGMGQFGMNPYQSFQSVNKFPTPYQFPSSQGIVNPYITNDDLSASANSQSYGPKFGYETGYGHTAVETQQSHYGPPMMHNKGGKLKGAALSALTLLAFLFFLNLLQSCLKDQMDVMNPTVMVMSAGQRNYLISRNDLTELRKSDQNLDDLSSEIGGKFDANYDDDYEDTVDQGESTPPVQTKKKLKIKSKRPKSNVRKQDSTIEAKLNNYSRKNRNNDGDGENEVRRQRNDED